MKTSHHQPSRHNVLPMKQKNTLPTRLRCSEDEARAKTDTQIASGEEQYEHLMQRRFQSDVEWLQYMEEYQQWHDASVSLLRALFTSAECVERFENASTPLLGVLGAALEQHVSFHIPQFRLRLQALHAVRDGVPYYLRTTG